MSPPLGGNRVMSVVFSPFRDSVYNKFGYYEHLATTPIVFSQTSFNVQKVGLQRVLLETSRLKLFVVSGTQNLLPDLLRIAGSAPTLTDNRVRSVIFHVESMCTFTSSVTTSIWLQHQ